MVSSALGGPGFANAASGAKSVDASRDNTFRRRCVQPLPEGIVEIHPNSGGAAEVDDNLVLTVAVEIGRGQMPRGGGMPFDPSGVIVEHPDPTCPKVDDRVVFAVAVKVGGSQPDGSRAMQLHPSGIVVTRPKAGAGEGGDHSNT